MDKSFLIVLGIIVSPIVYVAALLGRKWEKEMIDKYPRLKLIEWVIGYLAFLFFFGLLLMVL